MCYSFSHSGTVIKHPPGNTTVNKTQIPTLIKPFLLSETAATLWGITLFSKTKNLRHTMWKEHKQYLMGSGFQDPASASEKHLLPQGCLLTASSGSSPWVMSMHKEWPLFLEAGTKPSWEVSSGREPMPDFQWRDSTMFHGQSPAAVRAESWL